MTFPRHRDQEWPPPSPIPPYTPDDLDWLRAQQAASGPPTMPTSPPPGMPTPKPPKPSRLNFWLKGPGVMVLIVIGGLLLFAVTQLFDAVKPAPSGPSYSARVVDCSLDGRNAVASIELTNTGDTERTFEILIEYRDGGGARVDTDRAFAFNVPPGEKVRLDESTHLNAETASGTCAIAGVR